MTHFKVPSGHSPKAPPVSRVAPRHDRLRYYQSHIHPPPSSGSQRAGASCGSVSVSNNEQQFVRESESIMTIVSLMNPRPLGQHQSDFVMFDLDRCSSRKRRSRLVPAMLHLAAIGQFAPMVQTSKPSAYAMSHQKTLLGCLVAWFISHGFHRAGREKRMDIS